jgi:hypothetical protein
VPDVCLLCQNPKTRECDFIDNVIGYLAGRFETGLGFEFRPKNSQFLYNAPTAANETFSRLAVRRHGV